jgi:hypothetical protein
VAFLFLAGMNILKYISGYFLVFIGVVVSLSLIGNKDLLAKSNFLNWDAIHYYDIKNGNYESYRTAFFPLFPLIWKFSMLGIYGIVVFNVLLYLLSFRWLAKTFSFSNLETILFLSVPSALFYFLPYTEAFFFLFSTLILVGLKNERIWMIALGLFLCTLTRPSFTVLLPALLLTILFKQADWKQKTKEIALYIGLSGFGIVLVALIQFAYTQQWFTFFGVQKLWGNQLQFPRLPLTSWAGGFVVRLDGLAFLFCVFTGFVFLFYLMKRKSLNWSLPNELIFSICYLIGIAFIVLFFRGGSLFSLNRFVFATPFFLIVLHAWLNYKKVFSTQQMVLLFVGIIAFWFLFNAHVHIQVLLKFIAVSFYFFLLFLVKTEHPKRKLIWMWLFIGVNFTFQVLLYSRFLTNQWVG